jgi:hypothetical protein
MTPGDIRRALRKARRLGASFTPDEYREGWRIEGAIIKAGQRRASWDGGVFSTVAQRYRAEYLATMAQARRAGDLHSWRVAREGLAIWRGYPYPFAPVE